MTITATDLDTIRVLIEQQRQDEVIDIIEKKKAFVFKFKNTRPYVVPKKLED